MIFDGDDNELGLYIREMADLMGLRDWHFYVVVGPLATDEPALTNSVPLAQIDCTYGRKHARITLVPGWENSAPEQLRMIVVHELVHAHLALMQWIVNNTRDTLGGAAFDVWRGSYHDAEELAVDGIASAWAERMPLPIKEEAAV